MYSSVLKLLSGFLQQGSGFYNGPVGPRPILTWSRPYPYLLRSPLQVPLVLSTLSTLECLHVGLCRLSPGMHQLLAKVVPVDTCSPRPVFALQFPVLLYKAVPVDPCSGPRCKLALFPCRMACASRGVQRPPAPIRAPLPTCSVTSAIFRHRLLAVPPSPFWLFKAVPVDPCSLAPTSCSALAVNAQLPSPLVHLCVLVTAPLRFKGTALMTCSLDSRSGYSASSSSRPSVSVDSAGRNGHPYTSFDSVHSHFCRLRSVGLNGNM